MKPLSKRPQPPSEVPRRAEHDTSEDQRWRAGERAGEGAEGVARNLERGAQTRVAPGRRRHST